MGKILTFAAVALTAVALAVISSCNTSGCTDNHSAIPYAEFFSSTTQAAVTVDSVEITGVHAPDSAYLVTPGERLQGVYLPMRSTQTTTAWCIRYCAKALDNPALNDTVTLDYDSEPWFASEECGAMYRYRLRRVTSTSHLIDSVAVVDSLVTNVDRTTLRIYFRTASGDNPEQTTEPDTWPESKNARVSQGLTISAQR